MLVSFSFLPSLFSSNLTYTFCFSDDDTNVAHHARRGAQAAVDAAKNAAAAFDAAANSQGGVVASTSAAGAAGMNCE